MASAKMTAAHSTALKAKGATDADLAQLATVKGLDWDALQACCGLAGLDWKTLLALIVQYGPQIVAVLLALFGQGPLPNPLPPLVP